MICWHKWAKWSDPVNGIGCPDSSSTGYFKVLQMRVCEKCGKAEVRMLPKMRSIASLCDETRSSK